MAGDNERLIVELEARIRDFERNFAKATGTASKNFGAIEARGARAAKRLQEDMNRASNGVNASLARIGKLGAGLGAGLGVAGLGLAAKDVVMLGDKWVAYANKLRGAGAEGSAVAAVQRDLVDVAVGARAPLETVVELYSRLKIATGELNVSNTELLSLTSTLTKAFQLGGSSAAEIGGAVTQLAQGLSAGALRGDELNSVLEGAPLVARAIAAEFGVTTGELKKLGEAGELSSQRILAALKTVAPEIERSFATSIPTVTQATENLKTSFTQLIGVMNESGGASQTLAGFINSLAGAMDRLADAARGAQAATRAAVLEAPAALQSNISSLEAKIASGTLNGPDVKLYQDRLAIERARLGLAEKARDAAEAEGQAIRETARAKGLSGLEAPFSNTPYAGPVPRAKPDGLLLSARERGAGGGGSSTESAYARETQSIKEKIAALEVEKRTIGATRFEQERAKAALELETAAREKGKAITAAQAEEIRKLSIEYANAKVAVDKLQEAQRLTVAQADAVRSELGSALGGLGNDLANGVRGVDALRNAFLSLRTAVINALGNQLIAALLGGTGTPFSFFSGGGRVPGFATGGSVRGPGTSTSDSIPAMLSDGEFVVNAAATKRFGPLLAAINEGRGLAHLAAGGLAGSIGAAPAMKGGGASISISSPISVKVEGGSRGPQADQELADRLGRSIETSMRETVVDEIVRQLRPGNLLARMTRS